MFYCYNKVWTRLYNFTFIAFCLHLYNIHMLLIITKNMARFDMKNAYIVLAEKFKESGILWKSREAFVHDFYNCDVQLFNHCSRNPYYYNVVNCSLVKCSDVDMARFVWIGAFEYTTNLAATGIITLIYFFWV